MAMHSSSRTRLACLAIVLVLLILLSPQVQAQTATCGDRKWAVYHDCPGPHGCCRVQVDYLSASDLEKEGRTILGTYRTEEEALLGTCAKLSDVIWVNAPGGVCNGPKGDISGDRFDIWAIADVDIMDPDDWKCRQAKADGDEDGVADGQDRCEGTPGGTAVDGSGCPCDEEEPGCEQWCQAEFDKRGLPGLMIKADSSTGEPPNCVCTCIDEAGGLTTNCFKRDCNQECRDKYGPNAKWDGQDAEHCTQCICRAGWKMVDQKCISCEDVCSEVDKRVQHDKANSIEERCACKCDLFKGLEYDPDRRACGCVDHAHVDGDRCVCDKNWQPRSDGGCQECPRHSHSSGTNNEPCEPNVGWRWTDDSKQECVLEPRFVSADHLKQSLIKKGYERHDVVPERYRSQRLPAGTVTMWAMDGESKDGGSMHNLNAHCTMTINEEGDQIEMGADRAQVFGADAGPRPLLPQNARSATYAPHEIWLPPKGARLRPRLREELEGMSRGRKPKTMPTDTGGSDWNCHGFLDAAAEHHATRPDPGASLPSQIVTNRARYVPLKDPPGIPFAVELEAGALYGKGLEFDLFLPDGFVDFTHEFLVEVAEDGTARIYAFAGQANYHPSGGEPVTRVPGGQMVTVSGGQASAPVSFDAASLEPWWEGGSSTADTSLWLSLGGLAAGGGCCLLVLATASVLVWQVARRRRPRAAGDRGRPPHAHGGAWGTLRVTQGSTPSRTLRLVKPVVTIGRDPDNDLALDDHLISRHHAQIGRKDRIVFLYDLGSKNGTFVNGVRITQPQPIRPGDVIRVGRTELVV